MSINRRECLKYADPGLPFDLGSGLLYASQLEYITRSAVKNIAGRRVLLLYIYNRVRLSEGCNVPEYILYQYRNDYITLQIEDGGKQRWRVASLDNLGSRYMYLSKKCAFYRRSDEQRVTRFCEHPEKTGFDALEELQNGIKAVRLDARTKAKERRIIARMEPIPATPRGLRGWIHREILPHYIFYDYIRGKQTKGYCTACRQDILVSGAKHNAQGKCPNCGKSIKFKASRRATKVWDRDTVQCIHKISDNEVVVRIFKVDCSLRDWRQPDLTVRENARIFVRQSRSEAVMSEPYYYASGKGKLTDWKRGCRPQFSYYQYSFECDICGYLYTNDLGKALAGTPWQYCQLADFADYDRDRLEVAPYLRAYCEYPSLEFLVKLKLNKLAEQLVYSRDGIPISKYGRNLREVLGIWPEDLPLLQTLNANARQLELCQDLRTQSVHPDEALITWYTKNRIFSKDDILTPLMYTTPYKLMRYAEEQYKRLKTFKGKYGGIRYEGVRKVLSEYKDYLIMGRGLNFNLTDSFVLFPRNLQVSHDQSSKLYDTKKSSIYRKVIRGAYEGLLGQYHYANDEFTLIPPKTANEIVKEGHTLHHCVNTYVERVAKGKCIVLFIRRNDSINDPFYTVELQNNRVTQVYGMDHCKPTPEVNNFINLWTANRLQVRKAG
jgi:predicted RNA-binding Zn-ribbon protein involved in translation (DUF1610 family)/rubredoxin